MAETKDYIERGALIANLERFAPEHLTRLLRDLISKQPAADVVEVVRCRECKHKVNFQNRIMCDRNARYSTVRSEWYGLTATDNDNFCSYGERKDMTDETSKHL